MAEVDCAHSFTVPTSMIFDTLYSASIGLGDHAYYQISSWTSSGATFSMSVSSGMVVLYASDVNQSPSSGTGNYVWTVQTSHYIEIFLDPFNLGRTPGSTVYVSLQGQATTSNCIVQVNSGNTLSTGKLLHDNIIELLAFSYNDGMHTALSLGAVNTNTLNSASTSYYNIPYPLEGITLSFTVTSGMIACYASVTTTNPSASKHIWTVQSSGNADLYLDPINIGQVSRYSRVFLSIHGLNSTNSFTLTTVAGQHSSGRLIKIFTLVELFNCGDVSNTILPSELAIGSQIDDNVQQGKTLYYYVTHTPSSGLTVQIDALVGSVSFYASHMYSRPNASSYTWTLGVSGYNDIFIDPATVGLSQGSTLYFAIVGITNFNNFTLSTSSGDKSISGEKRLTMLRLCDL